MLLDSGTCDLAESEKGDGCLNLFCESLLMKKDFPTLTGLSS